MAIPIIQRTKESAIAVKDSEKLERIATGVGVISRAVEFVSDRQQKENKFIRDQWMMSKGLATSQMNLTKKEIQRFEDAQRKEADKDLQEKEDRREQKGLFEKIANYLLQQNKGKVSDKNLAKAKKSGFLKWLFITFGIADLALIITDTIARVKKGVNIFKAIFQSIGKIFAKPIAWVKNTRLWKGLTGFFSSIGDFFRNQKKKVLNGKWVQSIKNFFSGIGNLLRGIGGSIKKSKAFNVLKGLFAPQGKLGFIGNIFRKLNASVSAKGGIGKIFKGILDFIMKWTRRLRPLFKSFRMIGSVLFKFLGFPITLILGLIGGIKGFIKGFKEDGILGGIKGAFWGMLDSLVGSLVDGLSWLGGWILEKLGFEELGKKMQEFKFMDFLKNLPETFTLVKDKVVGFFKGAYDYVVGLFGGGEGEEKEGGKGILPKIADMFSFVGQIISWPFKKIGGFFKGAYDYVVGLFGGGEGEKTEEKKGILPSFSDMFKSVLDIFTTIPKKIGDFFSRGIDWVTEKIKEFDIIGMLYDFIDNSDMPDLAKSTFRKALGAVGVKDPREARRKEENALKKSMAEENEKKLEEEMRVQRFKYASDSRKHLRSLGKKVDEEEIKQMVANAERMGTIRERAEDKLRKSGQLVEYQDPDTLMERMQKLGRGLKASGVIQEDADRFTRMSNALKSTDLEKRRAGLQEMKKLEAEMKIRQEKRSAPVIISPRSQTTASNIDNSTQINTSGSNQDSLNSFHRAFAPS